MNRPTVRRAVLPALLLLASCEENDPAQRPEPEPAGDGAAVVVRAVDVDGGAAVPGANVGVRDARTGKVVAADADGVVRRPAGAGGPFEAVGAAFGYETGAAPLRGPTTSVALRACETWTELRVEFGAEGPRPVTCSVTSVGFPDALRNGWLQWTHELEWRGEPLRLPVPRGGVTRAYCRAAGAIVWPAVVELAPGPLPTVHVESTRALPLRLPVAAQPERTRIEILPDRTRVPPGGPWRADALTWHMRSRHEPWYGLDVDGENLVVRGLPPDCPLHAYVVADDELRYVALRGDETAIDVSADGPATPWVAKRIGSDLGETILTPGRVGLSTVFGLRSEPVAGVASRFVAAARIVSGVLQDPPPAYAPVVTVVSERRGLAWVAWEATEIPDSAWADGAIEVVPPAGYEVEGELAVRSAWRGVNSVILGDASDAMAMRVDTRRGLRRLERLADGTYSLDGKLRLIDASGRAWSWIVHRQAEVVAESGAPGRLDVPAPAR